MTGPGRRQSRNGDRPRPPLLICQNIAQPRRQAAHAQQRMGSYHQYRQRLQPRSRFRCRTDDPDHQVGEATKDGERPGGQCDDAHLALNPIQSPDGPLAVPTTGRAAGGIGSDSLCNLYSRAALPRRRVLLAATSRPPAVTRCTISCPAATEARCAQALGRRTLLAAAVACMPYTSRTGQARCPWPGPVRCQRQSGVEQMPVVAACPRARPSALIIVDRAGDTVAGPRQGRAPAGRWVAHAQLPVEDVVAV